MDRTKLESLGWDSLVLWECELGDLDEVSRRITQFLDPQHVDGL